MIEIKNKYVLKVYNLLKDIKLPLKDSRIRSKFCNDLAIHNDEVYVPARMEVVDLFAKTGDDGKQYVEAEKRNEYNTEMKILDEEFFRMECNEINKSTILFIKDLLNNERVFEELSGEDAMLHFMLVELFEKVVENYD